MVDTARFTHCGLPPLVTMDAHAGSAQRQGWEGVIHCDLPRPPPASSQFALEQHRIVHDVWLGAMERATDLPRDTVIKPDAFIKALGHVLLLEPENAGADFRYRIYGSRIAKHYGRDMTGKRVSDFQPKASEQLLSQYRHLLESRWGLYSEHDAPREVSNLVRWCRLALPFAGEDGAITRILVANVPVDRGRPGSQALQ